MPLFVLNIKCIVFLVVEAFVLMNLVAKHDVFLWDSVWLDRMVECRESPELKNGQERCGFAEF